MKKVIFISFIVIFASFMFTSCQNQTVVTEKTVTTITQLDNPGTNGFILKVKKGDTVWDFSQKIYGSGFKWRDIVSQNPFLNEPGRVEKRDGKWIVWIYPNEEIHIGNKVITANGNGQITETTKTTETTTTPVPIVPWWGWLTIFAVIALLAWLFWFNRGVNVNTNHITIGRAAGGIDQATNAAIVAANVERSYRFREEVARHAFSNPNLTRSTMTENSNQDRDFVVVTEYQPR